MGATARGSLRACFVWLAAIAHLLYQAVLFLFATPFNNLFLVYVAMLALSLWSAVGVVSQFDVSSLPAAFTGRFPARRLALFTWLVVTINGIAWLGRIVPAMTEDGSTRLLEGTGLTTNPIYVQDMALWLPLMTIAAWWLWQGRGWGHLIVGSVLTMWVIESLTIDGRSVDRPSSRPVIIGGLAGPTPAFVGVALVSAIPRHFLYRSVAPALRTSSAGRRG